MSLKDQCKSELCWETVMGACEPGNKVILRGKDLLKDFDKSSWIELLLYGICNEFFNENQVELLNAIWKISTSYPEPRVWNNRIASLAGTTRSTACLALGSGIAVSEGEIYGLGPMVKSISFLKYAVKSKENGKLLSNIVEDELKVNKKIYGFGRPANNNDERIEPLYKIAKKLDLHKGPHTKVLFEIEEVLKKFNEQIKMNVASLDAALCADMGFSTREFYYFMSLCFSAGIIFCNTDSFDHQEGSFLPIRCKNISYKGNKFQRW